MDTSLEAYDPKAAPDTVQSTPDRTPASLTKARLARLWSEILELDRVAPDDNFFLLGGDSLRAAALFAEVEATFGVTLPLETIFDEGETVAGMAMLIERAMGAPQDAVPDDTGDGATAAAGAPIATGRRPAPPFAAGDATAALTLLVLAAVAWLPRRAALPAFCRMLARGHIALRGSRSGDLSPALDLLDRRVTAKDIEIGVVAGGYEDMAEALREYGPRSRPPAVRLSGREHIDAALAAGRGAVLWNFAGGRGSRAAAHCLKAAGAPVFQLRSVVHPLSGSRFGTRVLNPILNRVDDRNLAGRVTVDDDSAVAAMQELGRHLRSNAVVRLSAHGAGGAPHEMPFLGGTLRLALGAPTLALLHDAPLLPIFSIPDGSGGFDVVIEPPLAAGEYRTTGDRARTLAERYAEILERYVRRHPLLWRGWFMRNTWRPDSGRSRGDG